ncbi:MAG TPA: hypothetical protein ENK47_02970 [Euryarchaeota archaeon]|nr:hypothetical protein [Euryarchaeota archaeon]
MKGLKAIIERIETESHDLPPSRVHGFLEICMTLTGRGEVGDDYIKAITFPLGNITIYSDPYYNMISVYSEDYVEMDLEDDDEVDKLADELKKRILSFDRKIRSKRKEVTEKVFDEPVDFISFEE